MLRAVVPLEPRARPRQQHRIVTPRHGTPFVQSYTPADGGYSRWRTAAVLLLKAARRGAPSLSGPLGVKAVFLFPMPKGEQRVRSVPPRRWHTAKPDVDNVLKAVLDVAVEAGWMVDDAPIVQVEAQKIVAAQDEPAAIHLTVWPLPAYGSAT